MTIVLFIDLSKAGLEAAFVKACETDDPDQETRGIPVSNTLGCPVDQPVEIVLPPLLALAEKMSGNTI